MYYLFLDLIPFFNLHWNLIPLGNWDPWGLHQVSKKVVLKYRESELKHGRLAMLATLGFAVQEYFHPIHPEVQGLAIFHMDQLKETNSVIGKLLDIRLIGFF